MRSRALEQKAHPSIQVAARPTHPRYAAVLCLLATAVPCQAALFSSCEPGDSEFLCRLRSVLTLLEVAAVILGLVLAAAILAAVRAYQRKPRKLAPEDLTPNEK